jgi:hypothetical protein
MSIIVTHISTNGIVHAADSNLTDNSGRAAGQAQKLYPIQRLDAALTVAGNFTVAGNRMDVWMPQFVAKDKSSDLKTFVINLTNVLNTSATSVERLEGYFLHIAGYVVVGGDAHPEFYHITNYAIDPVSGNYAILDTSLSFSEDFWSKYSLLQSNMLFANYKGYIYCNGFPSGRIAYFDLLQRMADFRSNAWANQNWQFRPPRTVDEEAEYIKHDMELIGLMFKQSNYSAAFIGGPVQCYVIKSP